jgi:hypothetical protein
MRPGNDRDAAPGAARAIDAASAENARTTNAAMDDS